MAGQQLGCGLASQMPGKQHQRWMWVTSHSPDDRAGLVRMGVSGRYDAGVHKAKLHRPLASRHGVGHAEVLDWRKRHQPPCTLLFGVKLKSGARRHSQRLASSGHKVPPDCASAQVTFVSGHRLLRFNANCLPRRQVTIPLCCSSAPALICLHTLQQRCTVFSTRVIVAIGCGGTTRKKVATGRKQHNR